MTAELIILQLEEVKNLKDHSNLMYNCKTGQIAERNWDVIFPSGKMVSEWHCITNLIYPVYDDGVYIGDSLD